MSPEGRARAEERYLGYCKAMEQGEYTDFVTKFNAPATLDGGALAIEALMQSKNPPDAIFFNGDTLAVGAHLKGIEMGLEYPKDVALMGLHDTDISAHIRPGLTTVRVPRYDIGKRAAQEIVKRLEDGNDGVSAEMVFEIIERGTT